MRSNHIRKDLEKLKKKIEKEQGEDKTFFYPEYNGVSGFLGSDEIFFVLQKPSTGSFPSSCDKLFYSILERHNFSNAHITDLVKTRGKAGKELDAEEIEIHWPYFEKEINLIKPKLLVACGKEVNRVLEIASAVTKKLEDIKVYQIQHYGYRFRNKEDLKEKLEGGVRKVREIFTTM